MVVTTFTGSSHPTKVAPKGGRGGHKKKSVTDSVKAGITFPVARIRRALRRGKYATRYSGTGPVYLAAVLEYMCAEVLECAGKQAHAHKCKRVTPRHVVLAVRSDAEMSNYLGKGVTISGGGVVPGIHAVLVPKKKVQKTDEEKEAARLVRVAEKEKRDLSKWEEKERRDAERADATERAAAKALAKAKANGTAKASGTAAGKAAGKVREADKTADKTAIAGVAKKKKKKKKKNTPPTPAPANVPSTPIPVTRDDDDDSHDSEEEGSVDGNVDVVHS